MTGTDPPLTPRQVDVLRLISKGRTAAGIAEELTLSVSTVKTIGHQLYQRLGVHTQGAAVDAGHRLGYLTTPAFETMRRIADLLAAGDVEHAVLLAHAVRQDGLPTGS